jgi:hypothetical protein
LDTKIDPFAVDAQKQGEIILRYSQDEVAERGWSVRRKMQRLWSVEFHQYIGF